MAVMTDMVLTRRSAWRAALASRGRSFANSSSLEEVIELRFSSVKNWKKR